MRHRYAAAMPDSNVKILALHLLAGRPRRWAVGGVG